jgi:Fe2+ transport system protein FeoA
MTPLLIHTTTQIESVQAMPLAIAEVGERLNIVSMCADQPGMEMLVAAGLAPGAQLKILAKAGDGVVLTHDYRKLAITGPLARCIWVRRVAGGWA